MQVQGGAGLHLVHVLAALEILAEVARHEGAAAEERGGPELWHPGPLVLVLAEHGVLEGLDVHEGLDGTVEHGELEGLDVLEGEQSPKVGDAILADWRARRSRRCIADCSGNWSDRPP